MYKILLDGKSLFYPKDERCQVLDPTLNLEMNTAGTLTFTCPKGHYLYEKIYNRKSMVRVYKENQEIFYGEVRSYERDIYGNKKVVCLGALSFLADSIQVQAVYQGKNVHQVLKSFLAEHNKQVEERKRIELGLVTITDSNDSLYRYTNYENTLEAIRDKLIDRLGGVLRLRHENEKLYLDYIKMEEYGKLSHQTIQFGSNLLDYTDSFSAEDLVTAILPLGAEIEDEEGTGILRKRVDISSVNKGEVFIQSPQAIDQFGFSGAVVKWNDVHLPENLMKKGRDWLKDHQFEKLSIDLNALDLSDFHSDYESIGFGDRVRCLARNFGMDRIFPVTKMSIPLDNPVDLRIRLGEERQISYTHQQAKAYTAIKEEQVSSQRVANQRVQSYIDRLTEQMKRSQGGYKLSEYDADGRWVRDLYMDTMDKNTATKVLQVNMNGIGGSSNGYDGPYHIGIGLDGTIYGERIAARSIDSEKLSVQYTSQVEKKIEDATKKADNHTDQKLKNYYLKKEVDTKLLVTDGKIEASVSSLKTLLKEKDGIYQGNYSPNINNEPAINWRNFKEKESHLGDLFYDLSTGYAYQYTGRAYGLEIEFSKDSMTESPLYDWVQIFYEYSQKVYALPKLGGSTISGAKVFVPSDTFYLYFKTDGTRQDYYGFKIDSIKRSYSKKDYTSTESELPKNYQRPIILRTGNFYPESDHNPYLANEQKLFKYSFSTKINPSYDFYWNRIKDRDIAEAKDLAQQAISRLTVAEGEITSMVKKGEFGTYMRQNYNSFLLGFNGSSRYVQIKPGEIGLYNGTINDAQKRASFDQNGLHFYRDGYNVGLIGTNTWKNNRSHKGLVFDLNYDGKYMTFAQEKTREADAFTTMLTFSRANSIYKEQGIHMGADVYLHGFKLHGVSWPDGGINATINYVQVTQMNSDGTAQRWGNNGKMVFKNGILTDLTHY